MSATIRQVVYDLLGDFKQIYDDAEITPYKMLYWVIIHADRLRKLHSDKIDSGAYVTPFNLVVSVDPVTGRNYFELPSAIYDMDKDSGIDYITYAPDVDKHLPVMASVQFTRTSPEKMRRLYYRKEEIPTPSNPYFYRLSNNIWLLGVEEIHITAVEAGLRLTLNPNDVNMDIDQPFDFPQDLLPVLKMQVLNMGRFVLSVPKDLSNDGSGEIKGDLPTQKLVSVNNDNSQEV